MALRFAVMGIALALLVPAGAALAQMDGPSANDFYGDPVLPDPPLKAGHVFPASIATEDVAAVAPAAGEAKPEDAMPARAVKGRATSCTALNPCAIVSPAARD